MVTKCVLVAMILFLYSCASILNSSHEIFEVTTSPAGATVVTYDQTCKTPCSLNLKRGKNYVLTIEKTGYEEKQIVLDGQSWDSAMWGNILLGGIIGLGVDLGTDKGYDFEPEELNVNMQKKQVENLKRGIASVKSKDKN